MIHQQFNPIVVNFTIRIKNNIISKWRFNGFFSILCMLTIFSNNSSAANTELCKSLVTKMSGTSGACSISSARAYYIGESLDVDSASGSVGGKFNVDFDWTCVLPSKTSSNYQQLGLIYDDNFHSLAGDGRINLKTNLEGVLLRTMGKTNQLGGYQYAKVLSIITAPESAGGTNITKNPNAIIAQEINVNEKKYFCGSQSDDVSILESIKSGVVRPGEYNIETPMPTKIVQARYTTSSTGMNMLSTIPSAKFTIGAATCKIRGGDIDVRVNDGNPMSVKDFGNIKTDFSVPLDCSSVEMDIPYRLTPAIPLGSHSNRGGIGITQGGGGG
ncbi:hypothetical protein, partial [Aeromonas finlandensis]|uniref:hypothetical protein n=1 Tax=Aeromonas finlandensis TaxID=1543375 RepID=UPI0019D411FE